MRADSDWGESEERRKVGVTTARRNGINREDGRTWGQAEMRWTLRKFANVDVRNFDLS
jgi:hypothetical protein